LELFRKSQKVLKRSCFAARCMTVWGFSKQLQ
jgi:hypothetical protein